VPFDHSRAAVAGIQRDADGDLLTSSSAPATAPSFV
jgi:hypothetical protein